MHITAQQTRKEHAWIHTESITGKEVCPLVLLKFIWTNAYKDSGSIKIYIHKTPNNKKLRRKQFSKHVARNFDPALKMAITKFKHDTKVNTQKHCVREFYYLFHRDPYTT